MGGAMEALPDGKEPSWPQAVGERTTQGLSLCDLGESQQFSFPIAVWQDPGSTATHGS